MRDRLTPKCSSVKVEKRLYPMAYPFPPAEVAEFFFQYYGPTLRALAALDDSGKAGLRKDLADLWTRNNRATDGSTLVESEYLEVMAVRA